MPFPKLDRSKVKMRPLAQRKNRVFIEKAALTGKEKPKPFASNSLAAFMELVEKIKTARAAEKPVIFAFGAHTIKNGLGPVLIQLLEKGWITHLATNGAGIIHDWEFSYLGQSSEHVAENARDGTFGNWEETGHLINLALLAGAFQGMGYGESVGALIQNQKLTIPEPSVLKGSAPGLDFLEKLETGNWKPETLSIPHRWKSYSLQAAAFRLGIPFTGHPMFGCDIIYNHPTSSGAAIGRTAERDFLCFANSVSKIEGGVYCSVGSAVMSPMIFEKSFSMSQNLALQKGESIKNHHIAVVDLQPSVWDWTQGEPPENNPDYYLRFNKSFSRMGGQVRYLCADNRDFFLSLLSALP